MVKKCSKKKIFLLDVDFDDESDTVIWLENKQKNKTYFNCGCCKNCLCNDTSSCKNCGCQCNCTDIDDYYEIEEDEHIKK